MKKINKIRKTNYNSVVNLDSTDCPSVWFSSLHFSRTSVVLLVFVFFFCCHSQLPNNTRSVILGVFPPKNYELLLPLSLLPYACDDNDLLKERRKIVPEESLSIASRNKNKMLGLCQLYCLGATLAMKAHTIIIAAKKISLLNIVETFSQILPLSGQLPFPSQQISAGLTTCRSH